MQDPGFESPPFGVTPDSKMVYRHPQFAEAYEALENGIDEGLGFFVITGDVGAGKTTLLRSYLAQEREGQHTAVILNTGLGPDEFLRAVAEDLRIEVGASASRKEMIDLLHENLLSTFAAGGQTVLFVDEAQHLSFETLELMRMLSNLETESEKLIQIALFGQNELGAILAAPELTQLRSRIAVQRHLRPLTEEEVGDYVRYRLATAAPSQPVSFSDRALHQLHRVSGGLPRRINILANIALKYALANNSDEVTPDDVRAANHDFIDTCPPAAVSDRAWSYSTVIAWTVLFAAVLGFVYVEYHRADRGRLPGVIGTGVPEPGEAGFQSATGSQSATGRAVLVDESNEGNDIPAIEELFRAYGRTVEGGRDSLLAVRPEQMARDLGFRWASIEAFPEQLAAVGLPALVRLDGIGLKGWAVVEPSPDSKEQAVILSSGRRMAMPWSRIGFDPVSPAIILLPLSTPAELLEPRMRGIAVKQLQNALFRTGHFRGLVNGVYGPTTSSAVRDFQEENGLIIDGVVGPRTLGALVRLKAWNPA